MSRVSFSSSLGSAFCGVVIAACSRQPAESRLPPKVEVAAATVASASPMPAPEDVSVTGGQYRMKGVVFKPAGQGTFPIVVYNHGSELEPALQYERAIGSWFQGRGIAVLFPYRRGAFGSDGPYWADEIKKRPPEEGDHAIVDQLLLHADDVVASVKWAAVQPFVDPARVAVAGCSFGGIVSLFAAERPMPARAVVDFAGGSMTWATSLPLQQRMSQAALAARVPVYFIQADNDFNTAPSRVLSQLMLDAGKPNQVEIFPPHGKTHKEGHAHFCNFGMDEWGESVVAFLRQAWKP